MPFILPTKHEAMSPESGAEQRKYPRLEVSNPEELRVRLGDETLNVVICDVSHGGVGFALPAAADIGTDDVLAIGSEPVVNLRGRVRWIGSADKDSGERKLGVQFDSVIVQPKKGDEFQEMVDAWVQVSQSYSTFDSFLRILDLIDNEILDMKLTNFPETLGGIALWMEQRLGKLNLWHVIETDQGDPEVQLLVDLGHGQSEDFEIRRERVQSVAKARITRWHDRRPYVYGQEIVIEFFAPSEGITDLLHKIGVLLGKRIATWTKLISQSIALDALSDELDRLKAR